MAAPSKCSLNNMLQSVLAVANQEANSFYPPYIYEAQRNIVDSLLISALVREYPGNPQVVDMLSPFIKTARIVVKGGKIALPIEYRDILGAPMISISKDGTGECGIESTEPMTISEFNTANLRGGCRKRPVIIVPQAEFASQTTSTYRFPTFADPIGYFSGKNEEDKVEITLCPYDITKVDVMYVENEESCVFPYITQPDDTYIFDPNSSSLVESKWGSNAFKHIFTAMTALYAAYSRDPGMRDWAMILKTQGIL